MFGWGKQQKKDLAPEDRFWTNFRKDVPELERLYKAHQAGRNTLTGMVRIVGSHLRVYDENLSYELGHDGERYDLVISAGGMQSNMGSVLRLVRAMPPIDHWKVTAFRPPLDRPEDVSLNIDGVTVNTDIARFALGAPSEGRCDILLVFREGTLPEDMKPVIPGFHILDMILGEYDVMTRIGDIEFGIYGEAEEETFRPMQELREQLNASLPEARN